MIPSNPIRMLYVTCPSPEIAARLARALVERGLAACTNAWPGMRSCYRWEGKLEEAEEVVLLVKTTAQRAAEAQALIVAEHPYELPCVIEMEPTGGFPAYLDWIRKETT